jgi:hypothetical protein
MKGRAAALIIAAAAVLLVLLGRGGERTVSGGDPDHAAAGTELPRDRRPRPSRPSGGPVEKPPPREWLMSLSEEQREKIPNWRERLKRAEERTEGQPREDGDPRAWDPFVDPEAQSVALLTQAPIERRLPAAVEGERRARVLEIWRELYRSDVRLRRLKQRGMVTPEDERAHTKLTAAREKELRETLTPDEYEVLTASEGPAPDPSYQEPRL